MSDDIDQDCGMYGAVTDARAIAPKAVCSTALLEELEAALTLLCSAREKLKQEEDSSDYHRLCGQIERLIALVSRRSHSSNDQALRTGAEGDAR